MAKKEVVFLLLLKAESPCPPNKDYVIRLNKAYSTLHVSSPIHLRLVQKELSAQRNGKEYIVQHLECRSNIFLIIPSTNFEMKSMS